MIKKSSQLLRAAPDIPTLHQLLAKCFQQPGEKLQVQWRSQENHLFILDVIYSLKERRPNWQLLSDKSGRRTIIADYAGHDILLVYKQITTAANLALEGRSADEASRLSKTRDSRDARAAAADWLESKAENNIDDVTPPIPMSGGLGDHDWSDDRQEFPADERQDPGSVAAAVDESPWSKTSGPAPVTGKSSARPQPPQPPQPPRPAEPVPSYETWGQSSAAADPRFNWAPNAAQQPQSASPSQPPSPTQPQARPPAPQPAAPTQPPAPVKVTTAGPQASPPKPLPAPGSQSKPQEKPIMAPKGVVHPDKGAGVVDKGGSMPVDKSAGVKKHQSPDKVTAPPKPAEKPAPEKPDPIKLAVPLTGDLTNIHVPKLFKELKIGQVSGKLDFIDEGISAIVYLEDGKPIEAWFGELNGDSALLEILLWTSGQYTLTLGMNAINRNVKTSPEVLVEHNKNIASLLEELAGEGLTATSTFAPSNALLSSEEFDKLATPDAPMELEKLARLYIKLDGKKTIAELNELQVLPRPALVQAIHHLYYNNIIDIVDPTKTRKEIVVTPKEIDNAAIQSVMTSLRRVDTGLFIYPAFLYFLQEEFFRIYRAKSSMSVLIFEMREVSAGDGLVRRLALSTDAIADATMRISSCKRHTDIVSHYEQSDYAILLPSTGSGGTKVFANKIIKALTDSPLAGTEGKKLSFSFGSASMPEDFRELSMLLGAAEMAMNYARQRGKPLVLFKEILEG